MNICYYCGKYIERQDEVEKEFPLHSKGGVQFVTRKFHHWCEKEMAELLDDEIASKESDYWFHKACDKLYEYLEIDDEGKKIGGQYAVMRIRGMYAGEFVPNGKNVKWRKTGYTYEEIYVTLVFCEAGIKTRLRQFTVNDDKHLINFIMNIIAENINSVSKKLNRNKENKMKLDGVKAKVLDEKFIKKNEGGRKRSRVSQLFKEEEDDKSSEDWYDDLF